MTAVGVLGIGRMGGSMARAWPRPGSRSICWNRTPDAAEALAARARRAGRRAGPAESPPRPTSASRCSPTAPRSRRSTAGRTGCSRARARQRRWSIRRPCRRPRSAAFEAAAGRRGAGILDAPVSGSVGLAESGKLTIMVGGDGGRPGARAAGPRRPGEDGLPHGSAGQRRGHEAGRQRGDLRPQPGGRGGARAGRGGRHRSRAGVRRADRERRRGAVRRLQAGGIPRAGRDAGGLRARPRGQGPAAHRAISPASSASRCPQAISEPRGHRGGRRVGGRGNRDFSTVAESPPRGGAERRRADRPDETTRAPTPAGPTHGRATESVQRRARR